MKGLHLTNDLTSLAHSQIKGTLYIIKSGSKILLKDTLDTFIN